LDKIDIQIGDRLKQARLALGFSAQKAFADRLGLVYQSYVNYEKGERSLPDGVKVKLYNLGINVAWLITGQGELFYSKEDKKVPIVEELNKLIEKTIEPQAKKVDSLESRIAKIEETLKEITPKKDAEPAEAMYTGDPEPEYDEPPPVRIPYAWDIAAGPPITQGDDYTQTALVPARLIKKGGRYYAASIRGTSMAEAGIRDRDLVLIRYTDTPIDRAIQVVRCGDKSTLKRLRETEQGWELHYEDGSGRVIPLSSGDYEVQGEFVAILPKTNIPE
jgi:SOS-response transcriptional repressor LexA/DNA-binding XRE family transcriptional regulator